MDELRNGTFDCEYEIHSFHSAYSGWILAFWAGYLLFGAL